jgi:hypothetical protein
MKNELIEINKDRLDAKALQYFNKMCGYTNKEQESDLQKEGIQCLGKIKNHIHIRALVSYYDSLVIHDSSLVADDVILTCMIFEQLEKEAVIGAYFYVITIEDINISSNDLLEQYYYNIWETAYLDAARDYLKELLGDEDSFLMESLGPGYYGMDIVEIDKFFKILDTSIIQVYLKENKTITPMKTNVGLYLKTNNEITLTKACGTCLGSKSGCSFCNKVRRY